MRQTAFEEIDRDSHGVLEGLCHAFERMFDSEGVAGALDDVQFGVIFYRGREDLLRFFRRRSQILGCCDQL